MKRFLALGTIGTIIYDMNSEAKIISRNTRTLWCGLQILYNYKIRFTPENIESVHEDTAKAIYDMCLKNDGLYVKFS